MYLNNKIVLNWIRIILSERFGYEFIFIEKDNNILELFVKDSKSKIIFDNLIPEFFVSGCGLNLPCTTWDSDKEGFSSPLKIPLPAPGKTFLPQPLIEFKDKNAYIHYDILGLTYWMLNRIEEIGRKDLDENNRFSAASSHAYRNCYLERPLVDEWLDILVQVIKKVWPSIDLKKHQFNIKVSHDVDSASRYAFKNIYSLIKAMGGDIIKRRDLKSAALASFIKLNSSKKINSNDPHNTFDWIMDISEQNNIKSAFYFICGQTDKNKDAEYNYSHPALRAIMKNIHERGHEIGLHPSYNTFQNPDEIVREAANLKNICREEGIKQDIWGGRMHFLRWEHPTTLHGWEKAGMDYDSTLCYADHAGFRCGTCFEYPAFDHVRQEILNLRIRPLVAMDCSVTARRYMDLGMGEKALAKFTELKDQCRKVDGCFSLLWHNSELDSNSKKRFYQRIFA